MHRWSGKGNLINDIFLSGVIVRKGSRNWFRLCTWSWSIFFTAACGGVGQSWVSYLGRRRGVMVFVLFKIVSGPVCSGFIVIAAGRRTDDECRSHLSDGNADQRQLVTVPNNCHVFHLPSQNTHTSQLHRKERHLAMLDNRLIFAIRNLRSQWFSSTKTIFIYQTCFQMQKRIPNLSAEFIVTRYNQDWGLGGNYFFIFSIDEIIVHSHDMGFEYYRAF